MGMGDAAFHIQAEVSLHQLRVRLSRGGPAEEAAGGRKSQSCRGWRIEAERNGLSQHPGS
jgi:hypothetical protein